METVGIVARNEVRQWLRNRWLVLAITVFVLLEIAICWRTARVVQDQIDLQNQRQQKARVAWLEQPTTNAHMATHHGTVLYKFPSPLAVFDPGVQPNLGTALEIKAHQLGETNFPPAGTRLSLLKLDATTPALLMQMIGPLLVVLMTYYGVSEERATGTLRLIQSQGVRWRGWVGGKLLAISLFVMLISAPISCLLGWAALAGNGLEASTSNAVMRATFLVGSLWLYLIGWGALSLGLSSRVASSRTALILLLLLWSAWTIILPRFALDVAQDQAPLPTIEEFRDQQRHVLNSSREDSMELRRRLDLLKERLLKKYDVKHIRDLPISFAGAKMMEIEKYTNEKYDEIQAELTDTYRRQDKFLKWFELVSPYLAIRSVSMAFSGTDREHHEAFVYAGERYRRNLVRTMNLADTENRQPGETSEDRRQFWGQVPPFEQTLPSVQLVLRLAIWPIVILVGWSGTAVALALIPPYQRDEVGTSKTRKRSWLPLPSEWRLVIADPVFKPTMLILALLTILASQPGLEQYQLRKTQSQEARARNELVQKILESAFRDDVDLAAIVEEYDLGFSIQEIEDLQWAATSPDLLSHQEGLWWTWSRASPENALAIGESTAWPTRYRLSTSRAETLRRDVLENPFYARIGSFDLTLFVAAILPLAIITLTHGLVSSERDDGTLALLMSQPVSLFRLFLKRILIRVSAATFTIVVIAYLTLLVQGCNLLQFPAAKPFLLWGVILFLYSLFWGSLSLAVNFAGGSSSANVVWLLLFWITLTVFIPRTTAEYVSERHSVLTPSSLAQTEREIRAESETTLINVDSNQPIVTDGENLSPQQEEMLQYWLRDNEVARRFQTVLQKDVQNHCARDASLDTYGWLSPVIAWRQAAVQLAGTSLTHKATFADQTNRFQEEYISYFQPYSVAEQELDLKEIQQAPSFNAIAAKQTSQRGLSFDLMLSLLAWNGVVGLAAYVCFRSGVSVTHSDSL
ncbi:DUF3526 domain-containing protein [Thalassoroseus pseudoceratinae]|uniref:DUF3526 domain-containing protein n=1 Tax=Thalassoroseus pseudoceratinae TaxID=2713176 RepID=UPI001421E000|nr:DUF3526 domain-containing protein [Thalassoroseus pseudoceratinae]